MNSVIVNFYDYYNKLLKLHNYTLTDIGQL